MSDKVKFTSILALSLIAIFYILYLLYGIVILKAIASVILIIVACFLILAIGASLLL